MDTPEINESSERQQEDRQLRTLKIEGALMISALAILLVLVHLGADQASKTSGTAALAALDTYDFYQAKNMRQTAYKIAIEQFKTQLLDDRIPKVVRLEVEKKIDNFQTMVNRYESDPQSGEGKVELLKKAKEFEAVRDKFSRKEPWFTFAESLIQVAIVLTSVTLIVNSPLLMVVAGAIGGVALLFGLNGLFLFF